MNAETPAVGEVAHLTSSKLVDPVCTMQVDPSQSAGYLEYSGLTYYFYSISCLDKFKNDPESFVGRAVTRAASAKDISSIPITVGYPLYTCPMHPEIRQNDPGSCPKCGMALERIAPIQAVSKTEYVCPMHPQIVLSEPGNCPICGMTLEPRVTSPDEEVSPELADMTRRFWVSVALTLALILIEMST